MLTTLFCGERSRTKQKKQSAKRLLLVPHHQKQKVITLVGNSHVSCLVFFVSFVRSVLSFSSRLLRYCISGRALCVTQPMVTEPISPLSLLSLSRTSVVAVFWFSRPKLVVMLKMTVVGPVSDAWWLEK
jgi:hypothetical protein